MEIRISQLDNETCVVEVHEGDAGPIVDYLNVQQNGYAIFGEDIELPIAVVDGRNLQRHDWFTKDHLIAIEAHELGHIRMQSSLEEVAELEGIRLLENLGYEKAANLLIERGVV